MSGLSEFTLFPQLSVELRIMVWYWASQEPNRIIFHSYRIRKRKYSRRRSGAPLTERDRVFRGTHPDYRGVTRIRPETRVPAVLATCQESREEAKKRYSLYFRDQLYDRALWFNPSLDIIIFEDLSAAYCFSWGGCSIGRQIDIVVTGSTMPVVERVVVKENIRSGPFLPIVTLALNFIHLKTLVMRTDRMADPPSMQFLNLATGRISPTLRYHLELFWRSDLWDTFRANGQIPKLQIMTPNDMWNAVSHSR